jgi:hypothetical protein
VEIVFSEGVRVFGSVGSIAHLSTGARKWGGQRGSFVGHTGRGFRLEVDISDSFSGVPLPSVLE